jgi:[ribosomal protein S5]-alanine N-acetyltransferase
MLLSNSSLFAMPIPQTIFLNQGLKLTPITHSDEEAVYALFNHPEVVRQYTERPIAQPEDTLAFIQKITSHPDRAFAIQHSQHGLIGLCGLHHWSPQRNEVEIGGTLHPGFWGRGIMQEAIHALLHALQREGSIRQVVMRTQPTNAAALSLAKKLRFEPAGIENGEPVLARILKGEK